MSGGKDEASNDIESGGEAIACPRCSETLDYSEQGHNWLCERCGILWSSKLWSHRMSHRQAEIEREMCEGTDELVDTLKEENDAMDDELDLSKPCEIEFTESNWVSTVGQITVDEVGDRVFYGCYVRMNGNNNELQHYWREKPRIRNISSPKYEPHTMESLLPLAGEWVHVKGSVSAWPLSFIGIGYVTIASETLTYQELMACGWATGPHAGKPVAREVK